MDELEKHSRLYAILTSWGWWWAPGVRGVALDRREARYKEWSGPAFILGAERDKQDSLWVWIGWPNLSRDCQSMCHVVVTDADNLVPILSEWELVDAVRSIGYEVTYSGTVDPDFQELTGTQVTFSKIGRDEQGFEISRKVVMTGMGYTFLEALQDAVLGLGKKGGEK